MKTIRQSMLVKYAGHNIPLPRVGELMVKPTGEPTGRVVAVRVIGKPKNRLHGGCFLGMVQEFEMDVVVYGDM